MKIGKLNDWFLFASHIGIIAGLVLVFIQLRQDQALTRAVLYSDATTARIELHLGMLDRDVATIAMKSLTDPEALTLVEMRVMDSYILTAVNDHRRRAVMSRMGLDSEFGNAENLLGFYFGNRYAQAWWDVFKREGEKLDDELMLLDAQITAFDQDLTINLFNQIKAEVLRDAAEQGSSVEE